MERVDVARGSLSPKELFSGGIRSRLRVPHPRWAERLFVVNGAQELANELSRAVDQAS